MNELVLPQQSIFGNDRLSPYMYLKGIKLAIWVNNENNFPIVFHSAIVQDRDNNNSDLDRRQNFFRDTTSLSTRAHPFNDFVAGTGQQYDFRMTVNPINGDHYKVITHRKMLLDGLDSSDNNQRSSYKISAKYYKINRRIAFDNVTDSVNWRPFYICHWWQPVNGGDYSGAAAVANVRLNYKTDVVFRNII